MIQFDGRIFFKWVGEKPPTSAGFVSTSFAKNSRSSSPVDFFVVGRGFTEQTSSVFFGTMVSEECFLTSPKNETF